MQSPYFGRVTQKFFLKMSLTKRWLHSKRITDAGHFSNSETSNTRIAGNTSSDSLMVHSNIHENASKTISTQQLRLFVGTWNVGGRAPTRETRESMQDWLMGSPQLNDEPADIYVIGFQEIVPLNARNILGGNMKDGSDAGLLASNKWEALINTTLNNTSSNRHTNNYIYRGNEDDDAVNLVKTPTTRTSAQCDSDDGIAAHDWHNGDSDSNGNTKCHDHYDGDNATSLIVQYSVNGDDDDDNDSGEYDSYAGSHVKIDEQDCRNHQNVEQISADRCMYRGIARKHMVGLFISVWVRANLQHHVKGVQLSSVGCGIMNRLGNKGSVSVSLSVNETSFCFICTHLRSGAKPNDVSRRNIDVNNILRRTKFYSSEKSQFNLNLNLPKTILAHDRIIWLGDLNYRLTLSPNELQHFLISRDWEALIESDELKNEKLVGGVFEGWHEGPICFAPTYKYRINSDTYSMVDAKEISKRRPPAWCDRILWHGKGLKQLSYTRCESKHSDHRPVRSHFMVEVESLENSSILSTTHCTNQSNIEPFLAQVKELLSASNPHVKQLSLHAAMLSKYNFLN